MKKNVFSKNKYLFISIIIILAYIMLYVSFTYKGATGVRGSDDFWYVADVNSLITGKGAVSNNVFPVSCRHHIPTLPRSFVHNVPNVYFAALPALIFGSYKGWIVLNIFCNLITACLIFIIVKKFVTKTWALLMMLTYLSLPLILMGTIKPMAEASIVPLVTLELLIYIYKNEGLHYWILMEFIAGLLFACRPNFIILLFLIPVVYVVEQFIFNKSWVKNLFILLFICIALTIVPKILFKPNVSYSNLSIINSGVPNKSNNMNIFFNLNPEPVNLGNTIENLKAKTKESLKIQFKPTKEIGFLMYYVPFNIMFIFSLLLLFKDKKYIPLSMFAIFMFLLHILTVIIFQNQDRYMIVSIPALLCSMGVFLGSTNILNKISPRLGLVLLLIPFLIFMKSNIYVSHLYHKEGLDEKAIMNNMDKDFKNIIPQKDVVVVQANYATDYLPESYLLRPREVLFILDNYTDEDYKAMLHNINGKWLICSENSPILSKLNSFKLTKKINLTHPYEHTAIYSISENN